MHFTHNDIVHALKQVSKRYKWAVNPSQTTILLVKNVGGRPLKVRLDRIQDKQIKFPQYELYPVQYEYFSFTSHFTYRAPEQRATRNKKAIFSCIRFLKEADVWEQVANREGYIEPNKNFTTVNERDNEDRVKIKKELSPTLKIEYQNLIS